MKPLSVYIAAPFQLQKAMQLFGVTLVDKGFNITAQWLTAEPVHKSDLETQRWAQIDVNDVLRADVIVAYNPEEWEQRGTGGRHVEFGIGVATGKGLVLVGKRSNIFHYLERVVHVGFTNGTSFIVDEVERAIYQSVEAQV